jgi:hypothetical protein
LDIKFGQLLFNVANAIAPNMTNSGNTSLPLSYRLSEDAYLHNSHNVEILFSGQKSDQKKDVDHIKHN